MSWSLVLRNVARFSVYVGSVKIKVKELSIEQDLIICENDFFLKLGYKYFTSRIKEMGIIGNNHFVVHNVLI